MGPTRGDCDRAEVAGLRVLVVEDFDLLRTLVTRVLCSEGHKVIAAANMGSAISYLRGERFDLLVIDPHLRQGQGTDIARQAVTANPHLRVLFLSGSPVSDLDILGFRSGFLLKPFDVDALSLAVRDLFRTASTTNGANAS